MVLDLEAKLIPKHMLKQGYLKYAFVFLLLEAKPCLRFKF